MKKLISTIFLCFFAINLYGFGTESPGVDSLNSSSDIKVGTITATNGIFDTIDNVYSLGVSTVHNNGNKIKSLDAIHIDDYFVVGEVPASIEAVAIPGSAWFNKGVRINSSLATRASRYGFSFNCISNLAEGVIYTNYPAATAYFSTGTAIITDPGTPFTSNMVGDYITIGFSYPTDWVEATGEIIEFIDSSNIRMRFPANGNNELTGIAAMIYFVFERPFVIMGDEGTFQFSVGADPNATFEIIASSSTNINTVLIESECHIEGHATLQINSNTNGCCSSFGILSNYNISSFSLPCNVGIGHNMIINNAGATDGHAHGYEASLTDPDNTNVDISAYAANPGLAAMVQHLGDPAELGIGINVIASSYTIVTTAFSTNTINESIFINNSDFIIIGSTIPFDVINVLLDTPGSQTIIPEFYYSTGGVNGLQQFSPTDNAVGFTQEGPINFDSDLFTSPVWSTATVTEITNGNIVNATVYYFILIFRTRPVLNPETPIESQIRITTLGTEFIWDKNGNLKINTVAITNSISEPAAVPGAVVFWVDSNEDIKAKWPDDTAGTMLSKP